MSSPPPARPGFNGATPLRVWKVGGALHPDLTRPWLQRSHTFEGVEGCRRSVCQSWQNGLQRSHTFEGVEGSKMIS